MSAIDQEASSPGLTLQECVLQQHGVYIEHRPLQVLSGRDEICHHFLCLNLYEPTVRVTFNLLPGRDIQTERKHAEVHRSILPA